MCRRPLIFLVDPLIANVIAPDSPLRSRGSARVGRGGRIRTYDPLLPKQVLYQAELRPDTARALVSGGFRPLRQGGEAPEIGHSGTIPGNRGRRNCTGMSEPASGPSEGPPKIEPARSKRTEVAVPRKWPIFDWTHSTPCEGSPRSMNLFDIVKRRDRCLVVEAGTVETAHRSGQSGFLGVRLSPRRLSDCRGQTSSRACRHSRAISGGIFMARSPTPASPPAKEAVPKSFLPRTGPEATRGACCLLGRPLQATVSTFRSPMQATNHSRSIPAPTSIPERRLPR